MFDAWFQDKTAPVKEKVRVFDIRYDSSGFPSFLIYYNEQWILKSAKYFTPIWEPF